MSAIFGIYFLDGRSPRRTDLERMADSLAHRGPDGAEVWHEGSVGLGHRMFRTTPESLHETLPLVDKSSNLALTSDARLDNRDELIRELGIQGRPIEQITDSELILEAYKKWGEECPKHFLGDFAFAVWDGRHQTLFCARDHFGVKPFCYHSSNIIFTFASEPKGLFQLPEVPRRLNELRVAEYLTSTFQDKSSTFYQDILRLPPAHSMTVNRDGVRQQCYWQLDPSRELRMGSDEEYARGFLELFTEAVRCRLRTAYPIGSMLSGGMDSSSVTCVARNLLNEEGRNGSQKLHTFSAVFDKVTVCDESSFITEVLEQDRDSLEPHYLHADHMSPLTDVDTVLWHQEEASFAGNLYINWFLYHPAKEHGVRVILDGFDGDTTISHGNGYLVELAHKGQWMTLAKEVKEFTLRNNPQGPPWPKVYWGWVQRYKVDPLMARHRSLRVARGVLNRLPLPGARRRSPTATAERPGRSNILNLEFVRRIGWMEHLQELQKVLPRRPRTERENHHTLLNRAIMVNTLEVLDRAAGAFPVELRFPFFDRRLIEYCLAMPPEQKLHHGWTRMLLRRAMSDILPVQVQWRGAKSNLAPSFDEGLLSFERERLDEMILKNPGIMEQYVDMTALREAYHRFISGKATSEDKLGLWNAVSLTLWLQRTGLTP